MKKPLAIDQNRSSARRGQKGKTDKVGSTAKRSAGFRKTTLGDLFGIDARSLAAFRIFAGVLLLVDLATRATDLRAMYTDEGMFSRAEISSRITTIWNWSFHFWGGSVGYQAVLFGLAGALAVALLAGFKTRIATVGSWLMLVSIHHRVPAILSGAEILLRMLLFWAMFLPLGRAWSVDRWRDRPHSGSGASTEGEARVLSVASAAILLQMGLMYLFSAISKSNTQWLHGEALGGILAHDFYASPPAAYLLRFPRLLAVLTRITLALEWAAPLLLFSPRHMARLRLAIIAALAAMHAGIGICLEVGLFSYVSLAGLTLFLPKEFWESRLLARLSAPTSDDRRLASPVKTIPRKHSPLFYATQGLCLMALIYVLALNLNNFSNRVLAPFDPEKWRALRTGLGLSQSWGMFGEIPSMSGWYVARAKLKDRSEIDLLRQGAAVDWRKPEFPARLYPNHFWQKLFREMTYFDEQGFQVYRAPVAEYLCRRWNGRNPPDKKIAEFEFVFCMIDPKTPGRSSPRVFRSQLVRLDFSPESDRPVVSGYSDAPRSGLGNGAP